MKSIFCFCISLILTACHPTNLDSEYKQTFICKSLIQGYLNAQQLGQYQFHQKVKNQKNDLYIYKQPTVSGMVLSIVHQPNLQFECSNSSKIRVEIKLVSSFKQAIPVLSINLINKDGF
ncbi:hypothetical protein [Acinetobacter equi]|uniref:Lipoprotein n=1 Tax=Acinetobacter equi TaxID=1324350 RepID=A0A0N9VXJ8_9GAMM|nr:hypothetical protein [Acinetobacter equi]ALH94820.1 hypothetical protein AOY20_04335 [Acinetobacter equi]